MAETLTVTHGFRKYADYDPDWGVGLNANWDDLDLILNNQLKAYPLHVQHTTTVGTDGGDILTTWTTRPLDATLVNRISGASVAGNAITLPIGTYRISGYAQAFACENHRAALYNTSDSTIEIAGSSARAKNSYFDMSPSFLNGEFTLVATKTFELRHIASLQKLTSGLGKSANLGGLNELFADIWIYKLSD